MNDTVCVVSITLWLINYLWPVYGQSFPWRERCDIHDTGNDVNLAALGAAYFIHSAGDFSGFHFRSSYDWMIIDLLPDCDFIFLHTIDITKMGMNLIIPI